MSIVLFFCVIFICICIVTYTVSFHVLKENIMITPNAGNMKKLDQSYIAGGTITSYSSVAQLCPTLWNPMDCSTAGFPVHHQLPGPAQTHVHWVSDAMKPSHPLLSSSLPTFNLSQHQSLFQWVSSSHQVAKVLEFQLQHQSFQWIFRTDFL